MPAALLGIFIYASAAEMVTVAGTDAAVMPVYMYRELESPFASERNLSFDAADSYSKAPEESVTLPVNVAFVDVLRARMEVPAIVFISALDRSTKP